MLQAPGWKLGLRGEVLGRDALAALVPAWEDLCGRSVEDNLYYSPRYAQALLESAERHQNVSFAVVWDGAKLIALLPVRRLRTSLPLLQPAGRAWRSKYTFNCTPLLDTAQTYRAADLLLDVLASLSEGEWLIPAVNVDGEVCRAITAALARRQLPWFTLGHFTRPSLEGVGSFDDHLQHHLRPNRRKDIARNRRRLEQLGRVEHETHTSGAGLSRAVESFLRIEAGGWKGRRGTALACDGKTRDFALRAFTGDAGNSICRADMLTLDGTPIAVSLIGCAGRTGFAVKSCYDEAYRDCCPGLLLEVEIIRGFLSEGWASRLDAATSESHILDSLWPGRVEVADLMFSLAPRGSELRLASLRRSDRTRRALSGGLKQVVNAARDVLDGPKLNRVGLRRSPGAGAESSGRAAGAK